VLTGQIAEQFRQCLFARLIAALRLHTSGINRDATRQILGSELGSFAGQHLGDNTFRSYRCWLAGGDVDSVGAVRGARARRRSQ
jgi:hypothetical protein